MAKKDLQNKAPPQLQKLIENDILLCTNTSEPQSDVRDIGEHEEAAARDAVHNVPSVEDSPAHSNIQSDDESEDSDSDLLDEGEETQDLSENRQGLLKRLAKVVCTLQRLTTSRDWIYHRYLCLSHSMNQQGFYSVYVRLAINTTCSTK